MWLSFARLPSRKLRVRRRSRKCSHSQGMQVDSNLPTHIERRSIYYHKYADDTQPYTFLTDSLGSCLDRLALCTAELQHWYWANDLLLNPDRSEAAFFGTSQGLRQSNLPASVNIAASNVAVKNETGKERKSIYIAPLYSVSKRSDMDHTVLPANYTMPAFHC